MSFSSTPPNSDSSSAPRSRATIRSRPLDLTLTSTSTPTPTPMDAIPMDRRCKRSDGKQWRCGKLTMPDKTVCEKHYYQAKKRAANSAARSGIRRPGTADVNDAHPSPSPSPVNYASGGDMPVRRFKEPAPKPPRGEEVRVRTGFATPPRNVRGCRMEDYSGRSSESSEAEGVTCHQCRRNDRVNVVWCMSCDQKGYCDDCIAKWYGDIPVEDIRKMCPACCGICNCRVCFNADVLIKGKLQEIAPVDKLRYLHSLLRFLLPVLKHIYAVQCFEIGVENRVHGIGADIPRAKITSDEQMCCDLCKIPIFDYHRHCTNCMYDLCLTCCCELRRASTVSLEGDPGECRGSIRSKVLATAKMSQESRENRSSYIPMSDSTEHNVIEFSRLFPNWKANSDGSIPCGPDEAGGCGSSILTLRRIFKINWAAKLVKNSEEMVSSCKVSDMDISDRCSLCTGSSISQASGLNKSNRRLCSRRDDSDDNILYYPALQDIKKEGITHFHKHWVKGEPVIVKNVFDRSSNASWDPMSIFRGIQDTVDWKIREDDVIVKAVNCSNQSEVDISLTRFIKGYSEGGLHEDGWPELLKLKDWPSPSALEELISCQRPESISNYPLVEFIHFKWGILNLAAKLPHALLTEVGPELLVAYGTRKESDRGDAVTNLQINMGDLSCLLMHTASTNCRVRPARTEPSENTSDAYDAKRSLGHVANSNIKSNEWLRSSDLASKEHNNQEECEPGKDVMNGPEQSRAGAIWYVFRRQDVPKLNEYLRVHWKEFTDSVGRQGNTAYLVYHQALFLNKDHRRKLKEELGIEPWTFEQHIGEAVFIPAGCPFQVRNLLPSVQLNLRFLSPESLGESARIAREIRVLPNDHEAKLKMLEVGKMSLYAASSAIREIQKIILDPEVGSDIRFDDRNLTATVAENLERSTKQRRITCT